MTKEPNLISIASANSKIRCKENNELVQSICQSNGRQIIGPTVIFMISGY